MAARIVAISGPRKGETFEIGNDPLSIGREASNEISLADPSVSRQHCMIQAQTEGIFVRDLNSLNGTMVDRIPVREKILKHGSQIEVGSSIFVYLDSDEIISEEAVTIEDSPLVLHDTIPLQYHESLYLNHDALSLQSKDLITKNLNSLLQFSSQVQQMDNEKALCNRLLDLAMESSPAERAVVLLTETGIESPDLTVSRDRKYGSTTKIHVSRTVTSQVFLSGVAVLCSNVSSNKAFDSAESLLQYDVQSVLCIPLRGKQQLYGVVYLDSSNPAVRMEQNHLQLLTAAASIASIALENLHHLQRLKQENARLVKESEPDFGLIGESEPMQTVHQWIAKVAMADSTVLIEGESGTGKELVARAIHQKSPRSSGPFVAINCAALTESLLESELFGHEKGAFTGAIALKKGKLEIADGGSLFLDEIGELAPVVQAKLLRFLQERRFERVGGTRSISIDVRIVAATNRDLQDAIKQGSFRQDLFYRLNVVRFKLAPLHERKQDISLLANYFLKKYSAKVKRHIRGISEEARLAMNAYSWPGNIRELENAIERAIVLGSSDVILPEDLPESVIESGVPTPADHSRKYQDVITETKRNLILNALEESGGKYTEAAKLLGVHPNYLHRLIRNLNLKSKPGKL